MVICNETLELLAYYFHNIFGYVSDHQFPIQQQVSNIFGLLQSLQDAHVLQPIHLLVVWIELHYFIQREYEALRVKTEHGVLQVDCLEHV